jgi:integrase
MISTGINPETGHTISKTIGYYKTYNDAYQALMEYHKNPYDADNVITLEQLYEKWFEEWSKRVSYSTIKMIKTAWKRCSKLYKTNIRDIRPTHIKECIDLAPTFPTKNCLKTLFNNVFDYALSYDLVEHNYARNFSIANDYQVNEPHIAFTEQEIDFLWTKTEYQTARMILIQCYMGWRPQELCNLLVKNVNIHAGTITGGMKTKAGINRVIPIPDKVRKLIEEEYNSDNTFLFNNSTDHHISYSMYAKAFDQFIVENGLNIKHRPHDCRKTFITRAKRKGVNDFAIKYIVGHTISDITERVYTERDPEWLRKEINLV